MSSSSCLLGGDRGEGYKAGSIAKAELTLTMGSSSTGDLFCDLHLKAECYESKMHKEVV